MFTLESHSYVENGKTCQDYKLVVSRIMITKETISWHVIPSRR